MKKRPRALKAQHTPIAPASTDQEFRYGWIGPSQAMRHLGLRSLSALYRLINEWNLPYGRMGRRYRFRRNDLDAWLLVRGPAAFAGSDRRHAS